MWLGDGVTLGDADVVALGEVVDWPPPQLTSSRHTVTNTPPPRARISLAYRYERASSQKVTCPKGLPDCPRRQNPVPRHPSDKSLSLRVSARRLNRQRL